MGLHIGLWRGQHSWLLMLLGSEQGRPVKPCVSDGGFNPSGSFQMGLRRTRWPGSSVLELGDFPLAYRLEGEPLSTDYPHFSPLGALKSKSL